MSPAVALIAVPFPSPPSSPLDPAPVDKKYSLARIFAAVWRSSDAIAGSWRVASVKDTISRQRCAWNGSIVPICGQERRTMEKRKQGKRERDVTEKEKTRGHKSN